MQNIESVKIFIKNGHVLVGFLIFLPLLLSGLASLSVSALYLKEKTKILSICRKYTLQIQGQMAENLDLLQKLNPLAKQLRLERKKIERLLLNAPPAIREALLIRLSYVIAKQIKLNLTQRSLIKKAEGYAMQQLRRLKQKIQLSVSSSQVPLSAKLAVVAEPAMSLSPSYKTAWNFTQQQSIKIRWTEKPLDRIPLFLKTFLGQLPLIKGQCLSTLRRPHWGDNIFVQHIQKPMAWQPVLL